MTTIAPPTAAPQAVATRGLLRGRLFDRTGEAAWVLPATAGVLVLAAVLYLVNLTVSGYANVYYSEAAWAGSVDWWAWIQGSLDPANFITVDKPPLATMIMGLSVRLFGLSSASILLPQALMGVATTGVLMATVKRTFGAAAGIIAGLVFALTPAAVLIFRYNNPDALLTLLLVGAAAALVRALESDRFRWLVLSGVLVGLAFNTKLLQAYLVLPAFALTFAVAAPGSLKRRAAGLAVAAASVVVSSSWWVALMELVPAAQRAYVGGSTGNSAIDLVLGYDGLGRIFGGQGNGGGGGASAMGGGMGGGGFSGTPGILRLFNAQLGGQIAWLLPASIVGLGAGLVSRLRAPRTDLARAAFILWGAWLAVHALVFSFMSGTIHSYYVVAMAPAVGALVGGGMTTLWRARERHAWAGAVMGATIAGSGAVAWMLLERTPDFAPGLSWVVLAVSALTGVLVAIPAHPSRAKVQLAAAALGMAILLAGPAAYAVDTMQTAYSGGDPSAGPQSGQEATFRGGQGGPMGSADEMGTPPSGTTGAGGDGAPQMGGMGGGMGGASLSDSLVQYLVDNHGDATWLVAVSGSSTAGNLELSTGRAVMAMGGFNGGDAAPTLDQLKAYIASGELRFVLVSGNGGGPMSSGASSDVSSWVTSACTAVTIDGTATSVYDCAGAAG